MNHEDFSKHVDDGWIKFQFGGQLKNMFPCKEFALKKLLL